MSGNKWNPVMIDRTALGDQIERKSAGSFIRNCLHPMTHLEDWPDGGEIEVCDDCGMSRYHWEQGESSWVMVEDIPGAREEVKKGLESMREIKDELGKIKRGPIRG